MLLLAQSTQFWYCLPLALTVSLVYSATRFEELPSILRHSFSSLIWMGGFSILLFRGYLALLMADLGDSSSDYSCAAGHSPSRTFSVYNTKRPDSRVEIHFWELA